MQRSIWITIFMLVIAATVVVEAVNRGNFRTCEQTSFCKRQRSIGSRSPVHYVDFNTVQFYRDHITADVKGPTGEVLSLDVLFYEDSTVRLKINDKAPLRPRYEVRDVLQPLKPVMYEVVAASSDGCTVLFGTSSLQIAYSPFRADVFSGRDKVMAFNSRGLFNFEVQREKGNETDPHGLWEEHFGSHRDVKPYGPMALMVDVAFERAAQVYGVPLHATSLALKPTNNGDPYRLYNLDVFEYELDNPMALYGSVPFMLAHGRDSSVGVLWLNAAEMFMDVEHEESMLGRLLGSNIGSRRIHTRWMAETGIVDLFFMTGPRPRDVLRQYTALTGRPPLPQRFATAYHQCRWNYRDEADVKQVDAGFDSNLMPYDVLWLDIEHTDGKKYFTWDGTLFPTPAEMQRGLAEHGRKMVTIVDPHIKRDNGYYVHSEALARGYYIKKADGQSEYDGHCWPGSSSWLDFTNPAVRDYWAELFSFDRYKGSTPTLYTWNDMNEPSVFSGPEVTMHKDARHLDGSEHREVHNIYGLTLHMATFNGHLRRHADMNDRPFVLTRAFFAGTQRYGAIWTGDNSAQWGHLVAAQPMLLSMGVAGLPFVGSDVGGFFGNPDSELVARWYQAGAFHPFFRGHAHIDTKRREPWLFGEPYTSVIRAAIRTRYALLPYWYTLWWHASTTGTPLMRPLWYEFPEDERTYAVDDSFMLGDALLIKPVTAAGQTEISVLLPGTEKTIWYAYEGHEPHRGGQSITVATPLNFIPVYQRGGSIVVRRDRPRRASPMMERDPFTIVVAIDSNGAASGDLYLDDGHTFNYARGDSVHRSLRFTNHQLHNSAYASAATATVPAEVHQHHSSHSSSKQLAASLRPRVQDYSSTVERVVVVGLRAPPRSVTLQYGGSSSALEFSYESDGTLTVRKPDVPVHEDWSIVLG